MIVKLRYFAGLTLEETAENLDISVATVKRQWAYARAWLISAIVIATGHAASVGWAVRNTSPGFAVMEGGSSTLTSWPAAT